MKTLKYGATLMMCAVLVPALDAQVIPKLGYIDSQQIIEESAQARTAQEAFDRDMARFRSEVQQMGEELQTMVTAYEQQRGTMAAEARQARETEIQAKNAEYEGRLRDLENQAAQRRQELVAPVMERINEVIDQIRREGSYAMILDVAAGSVIAADPSLDLTQEVLRRLQAEADRDTEAGAGAPPAS
jgi:outer membrane protein